MGRSTRREAREPCSSRPPSCASSTRACERRASPSTGASASLRTSALTTAAHALRRSGPASLRVLRHGLVELARLTTGKTTHEVEDITDFLIASGYDLNRVLEFLEPVRHATRFADLVKDRPYAAFIAENGELSTWVAWCRRLPARPRGRVGELPMAEGEAFGTRWLLLATAPASELAPWIGLRFLGTALLKGLEPTPLAEMVVFEQPLLRSCFCRRVAATADAAAPVGNRTGRGATDHPAH